MKMELRVSDRIRTIVLRSDRCTNSCRSNHASYVFPKPMVLDPNEDGYIFLRKFNFPHSFYLIDEYTDRIDISGTTYTLEHGNYNAATILVHLREVLPISVDYSPSTYKFTLSNSSDFQLGSHSTCLIILGFCVTQCDADTTSLQGARCADLYGPHTIRLMSNFTVDALDSGYGNDSNMLARIAVDSNTHERSTFQYSNWYPAFPMLHKIKDRVLNELSVYLLDENGNHLCLNGVPFAVTCIISIHRRDEKNVTLYANRPHHAAHTRESIGPAEEHPGQTPREHATPETGVEGSVDTRRRKRRNKRKTRKPKST